MTETLRMTAQIWQEDDALAMIKEVCELTIEDMTPEELRGRLHPTPTIAPFDVALPGDAA